MVLVETIVNACINLYKTLPKTGKPNEKEWTVISAVVSVFNDRDIKVLSMGTGSKCIGQSSMTSEGDVLNDSHAEVIARRAFLKYLYLQIIQLNETDSSEIFYRKDSHDISVYVKDSVKFYFVSSMAPCGDASIMAKNVVNHLDLESYEKCLENSKSAVLRNSLKRAHSSEELSLKRIKTEATDNEKPEDIHRTGAKCLPLSSIQDLHLPGVFYHSVGAVRTKPGRGDPTLSVSCSDKIARWNAVGWEGALLSLFIKTPIFVDGIICGGCTAFSKQSFNRAINERIKKEPFIPIYQSIASFPNTKGEGKKPSPSSIIFCNAGGEKTEVSINGRRQGVTKGNFHKKIARNSICKKELFILFLKVVNSFSNNEEFIKDILSDSRAYTLKDITYGELKLKAQVYQRNWKTVKEKYFKVWSNKPANLLNFYIKEE